MLNASSEGSIVLTIALDLALTIVQAQSIRSRFYSVHYSSGKSAHYTTVRFTAGSIVEQKFYGLFEQKKNHKAVSMVITLKQGLTLTILQAQST